MLEKVRRFIAAEGLLSPGARVVVGFSGGADSVCLLETLRLLAPELSLTLFALHVHHGIRGKEADGDAAYAEDFCRKRGIPLRTVFRDIPAEARAKSLGLEEAGRLARREELTRALRELPADAAALAHHKNDLAETLLFQLARGTGLAGLSGISPANGAFIRPLLCLTRGEIEAWLLSRKISWREDSTNADTQYARNRIRHEILPGLSKVNAQAVTHMAEAASEVREAYTYLESLLPDRWRSCAAEGQGEIFLSAGELLAEPPLLQRMLIREAFRRLGGLKDLGKVHVEAVLDLLRGAEGRRRDLPGMLAVRTAKDVVLAKLGEIAVFGREKSGDGLDRRSDPARKEILVSGWERPGTGQAVSEPGETENARKGYLSGERTELKIPGETIYGGWRFKAEILCFAKAPGETTFDGQRCKAKILALHKFDNGNQRFPVSHYRFAQDGRTAQEDREVQEGRESLHLGGETSLPQKLENDYTKCFDYDKIKGRVELRHRENGDYLVIHPDGRRKTVSNLFTDRKLPKEERDSVVLLAAGQEVLWAVGVRTGEAARVDAKTRWVLWVSAKKDEPGRGTWAATSGR